MNLLGMFKRAPTPVAQFPAGRVGFAVGDIHGRADLLEKMFALLEQRAEAERRDGVQPIVIFLGDYVDRGRESARVIDLLIEPRPSGYERRFLRGNHEQSMLAFMEEPLLNRGWLLHGGAETLMSYAVTPPSPVKPVDEDLIDAAEKLKARLPPAHLDFLTGLERYVELGDYAFVHAGVDPFRPLAEQTDDDLYWIRERFLNNKHRFTHCVVHGHTPVERPIADDRRVSVDTGAYASGTLTAARFEGAEVAFLNVSEPHGRHPGVSLFGT